MSEPATSERAVAGAEELRRILVKYEQYWHADYIAEALLFAEHEHGEFLRRLASGDVWGSAGSVDDMAFEPLPGQHRSELESDWKVMDRCLLAIAEAVIDAGLSNEKIRWRAQFIRTQLGG